MGWAVAVIANPWYKTKLTAANLLGKHAPAGSNDAREAYLAYMRKRDADAEPWRVSDD